MSAAPAPSAAVNSPAGAAGRAPPAARWLPGFLALALIWGSSFLFIKVGIGELHRCTSPCSG